MYFIEIKEDMRDRFQYQTEEKTATNTPAG